MHPPSLLPEGRPDQEGEATSPGPFKPSARRPVRTTRRGNSGTIKRAVVLNGGTINQSDLSTHMINFPHSALNFDFGHTVAGYAAKGFVGTFLTSDNQRHRMKRTKSSKRVTDKVDIESMKRAITSLGLTDTMMDRHNLPTRNHMNERYHRRDVMMNSSRQVPPGYQTRNTDEILNMRTVYNLLSRDTSPFIQNKKHAKMRIEIMDNSTNRKDYPPTAIEFALKAARRYRHPERASANMPATPRSPTSADVGGKDMDSSESVKMKWSSSKDTCLEKDNTHLQISDRVRKQTGIERALKHASVTYGSRKRVIGVAKENSMDVLKTRASKDIPAFSRSLSFYSAGLPTGDARKPINELVSKKTLKNHNDPPSGRTSNQSSYVSKKSTGKTINDRANGTPRKSVSQPVIRLPTIANDLSSSSEETQGHRARVTFALGQSNSGDKDTITDRLVEEDSPTYGLHNRYTIKTPFNSPILSNGEDIKANSTSVSSKSEFDASTIDSVGGLATPIQEI